VTAEEELALRAIVEANRHVIMTLLTLLLKEGKLDGDAVQDLLLASAATLPLDPVSARAAAEIRDLAKHLDQRPSSLLEP